MRILIDADGCPVVDITVEIAKKYNLECIILCDTAHEIKREGAETRVFSKGEDSVDFALVNLLNPGDIVVTQDYGLAAMSLARKAHPINQDGREYTENNIDSLLFSRHISQKIRKSGGRLKGPSKRVEQQDEDFRKGLEKLCRCLIEEKQC